MKKKVLFGICGIVIVAVAVFLIFKVFGGQAKPTSAGTLYDFSTVQTQDLSEKIDATGSVILAANSEIYPSITATLRKIYCKAGDTVKKGQILMALEAPGLEEQWTELTNSLNQAQLNLDSARTNYRNVNALFEIQGASAMELEQAQNQVTLAEQQKKAARLKLDNLLTSSDGANFIGANHRDLLIKAPFNGIIAWVNSVVGASVSTQTSLLSIAADQALAIGAEVDESDIKLAQPGQKVEITANDPDQPTLEGRVSEVGTIGKTTSGIVNFPVRIELPKGKSNGLKAGMSVDLTIVVKSYPNVLAIPVSAVVERRGKTMVGVKNVNNEVNFVRVETGVTSGSSIEILSGLKAGDVIAIEKAKTTTTKTTTQSSNQQNNRQGNVMMGGMDLGPGPMGR